MIKKKVVSIATTQVSPMSETCRAELISHGLISFVICMLSDPDLQECLSHPLMGWVLKTGKVEV
jgi:hypothetical protein